MTKTINLMNLEVLNILGYLANEDCVLNKQDCPLNLLWSVRKGKKKLAEIQEAYLELEKEINESFNDDEHSEPAKDNDGNDIRQVKPKYYDEFIQKKNELLLQKNEVSLEVISMDDVMSSGMKMKANDLDILSVFIDDEDNATVQE